MEIIVDKRFTPYSSRSEEQRYIKSEESTFSLEQEVESIVPVSNDYLYYVYGEKVYKNAKSQDGGDKMVVFFSISGLNKLHVLLYVSTYKL